MMKAILTGHTRGLGEALAEALLSRQVPVLGLARQHHQALGERYPELLQQVRIDLADAGALASWLGTEALPAFMRGAGQLLLINNAGRLQPVGPLAAQPVAEIAAAVSLNVAAPLMLSSAVASGFAGELRILHVSSGAARSAYPGWSVYCAAKAALDHHARAVALDGRANLRICSLAPGVIDTDMQAAIRATSAADFPPVERFKSLKLEGLLLPPEAVAEKLLAHMLSPGFGDQAIGDLREL